MERGEMVLGAKKLTNVAGNMIVLSDVELEDLVVVHGVNKRRRSR